MTDEFLTVDEACALLGVKKATLYSYVSRGLLRSYKQGIRRQRLYKRSELEELLTVRPDEDTDAASAADATESAASGLPAADDWVGER